MDGTMSNKPRTEKVLAVLLASMTAGAVILMMLNSTPPTAGPFNLSSYYKLDAVEKSIYSYTTQSPDRWNRIEVFYSGTRAGNIEQLAALTGLSSPIDLNCHFCICNGLGAVDGKILTAERWQQQFSCIPSGNWYGSGQTIRICVIGDGRACLPTDTQIKRTQDLVEAISRRFEISPQDVYYPGNWH